MTGSAKAELPSGPILRVEPGMHGAPIKRIDVDAGERFLVTGSDDKTVRVWSLHDGLLLATLRVPLSADAVGKVYAVAISPDGERVAAGGWGPSADGLNNSAYIFDRARGRIVNRIDGLPDVIHHLAFSPDGRHLVACLAGANGIRVYEAEGFGEVAADGDYGNSSYGAAFDREGRLVTSSYDGRIRLYDPGFRLIESREAPGGERPVAVAVSADGAQIAVGYNDTDRVDVLDGLTLAPLFQADTTGMNKREFRAITWSVDGQHLYAGGWEQLACVSRLRRWARARRGAYEDVALSRSPIMGLRPLADGRLAFGASDPTLGVLGADGRILWRQDPANADFRDQHDKLGVSADGSRIAFGFEAHGRSSAEFDLAARRLTLDPEPDPGLEAARVTAAGLEIEKWEDQFSPTLNGEALPLEPYERSRSLAIAPASERFLLGTDWWVRLFDRKGEQHWSIPMPGAAWAVDITGDGRLAVAAFGDGTIRWYRLEDGEELLAFFPHADRERWVAWTPSGYYMASPGGEELIGWHVNRGLDTPEFYTAGRFRDRFHRPDVIAMVLEELDVQRALARANREAEITPAPAKPLEEMLPPVIQILEPASGVLVEQDPLTIRYHVWTAGGEPVPTIRVIVNGVLALTWNELDPAVPPEGRSGQLFLPVIPRARDGRAIVRLIAENVHGASDPAAIGLQIAATAAAEAPAPTARLFVLAVGVSHYKRNPPDNLKYAARDAEDIAELFRAQKGLLYKEVALQWLVDADATLEGITNGIVWLLDQVGPDDVVMIFFAGHGLVERDVYYFLPHDVSSETPTKLSITAVDEQRLLNCFETLFEKQAKVYAFFDCCYAGAIGPGARAATTDLERFASKLAREENGVVVFTSCTGTERSREDDAWQNGAFTEALLEALGGRAARKGEGVILLSDVKRYLRARVPELTGGAQTPKVYIPFEEDIDPPIAVVP